MKRLAQWTVAALAVVALLAIAALIAVPRLVDTPRVQALIAGTASQSLGRPVKFTSVSVRVLPRPAVELHGLEVAEDPDFGREPFLRLERGRLNLRLGALLTGRVEFGDLVLQKPLIAVIQNAQGKWNIASLGAPPDSKPAAHPGRSGGAGPGTGVVPAARVRIADGVLTYAARGAGPAAASQYRVEGLDLTLTSRGTLMAFEGGAKVMPGDLAVEIADGTVGVGGARNLLEAPVRARVTLEGKDVSDLVAVAAGPEPDIDGAITGTLTVGGTVGEPTAAGAVELTRASVTETHPQCPEPKRRTLAFAPIKLNASWQEGRFAARPLNTGIGKGTVTMNVAATLDRGLRVQLNDLALKDVPLDKVLVDFMCQGYAVTGPLDLTGSLAFDPADLFKTLSGPGQFRIGPGKVVGSQALALVGGVVRLGGAISSLLSADLPSSLFSSPLEFDSITGTYQITNGVVTIRDLLYTSRAMKVATAGDYALTTGRMNLDMVVNHGRGEVKAKVTGTAASPSVRIVPTTGLGDIDPGKVERGLQDLLKHLR